jgi:mannose-6-phosphate isomerase-like protein (cupin superfamily)
MKSQTKSFLAGLCLLLVAALAIATYADTGAAKSGAAKPASPANAEHHAGGMFHLSHVRGSFRAVDMSPLGKEVSSEIVAGPANGLDSAFLIYTRMPAGTQGPAMYELPVDHTYLVLSGQLNVQLGADKFVAKPDTLVLVHAGVPHHVWNAGSEPNAVLEVVTPAPANDLQSLMKPAQPRKIENAASFIRVAPAIPNNDRGANSQPLAARDTDSGTSHLQERIDNAKPGSGVGPGLHVHPFDQIYFVLAGTMTLQYGVNTFQIMPNTFAIIPTGVVHYNKNNGTVLERHVTLLLPEPEKEPFDLPVQFLPAPVRPGAAAPAATPAK